jgi:hypothetical protein
MVFAQDCLERGGNVFLQEAPAHLLAIPAVKGNIKIGFG